MMQQSEIAPYILVRGAGDLATGTILKLQQSGLRVLAVECAAPSAIRRKAAFCEAVFHGQTTVEGVTCRLIAHAQDCPAVWARGELPILVDETLALLADFPPLAIVDAIIAKRNLGTKREMAPITIALGPGFTAGVDVDAVIETMRGHRLGRVFYTGSAEPNTGIPGAIAGHTADRVIHAPAAGSMHIVRDIGSLVTAGETIGFVGETPVPASIDGVLRGILPEGYPVTLGLKMADIDPRVSEQGNCFTVSDKARTIAGGVLEALLHLAQTKGIDRGGLFL